MTLDNVLQELIQCLAHDGDTLLPWDQVRRWPKGGIEVFQNAGWIVSAPLASAVICPGCEAACYMPVAKVIRAVNGRPARAYIACDQRPDMGTVKLQLARLQQWQLTQGQLAYWITDTLTVRYSGKRLDGGNLLELGLVSGEKRAQMLCLHTAGELALVAGSNRIPLVDAIQLIDGALSLDANLIRQLVDSAATGDARYTPNTARREVRKLETAAMHEQWQKEYRALQKKRPNRSDVWYSQQIAKMECAQGRSAGTIKKNMK